jgi:TFIIF-interacting CTD phosphatase-like protein
MNVQRSVVLLDLDNTLVHTTFDTYYPCFESIPHPTLHIHVRPYAREFLSYLIQNEHLFELGFWTCGLPEYAYHVVKGLLSMVNAPDWNVRILLTRDDAMVINGSYVKNLSLVKKRYGVNDILLLDDNVVHYSIPDNVPEICLVPAFYVTDPNAPYDSFLCNLTHLSLARPPSPPQQYHRPQPVRATSSMVVPAPW